MLCDWVYTFNIGDQTAPDPYWADLCHSFAPFEWMVEIEIEFIFKFTSSF